MMQLQTNPLKGEYFLPSVVSQLVGEGKARVKVLHSPDKWYGVTYQDDKPVVVAAIAEKTAGRPVPGKPVGGVRMRQPAEHTLPEALAAFDFGGQVAGALRYGQGHINDTFCVYVQTPQGDARRFILQRINTGTFRDPKGLMENIVGVTDYLRDVIAQNGGDPAREAMTVLRTRTGGTFFAGSEGGAWRAYPFLRAPCACKAWQAPRPVLRKAQRRISAAFSSFWRLPCQPRCTRPLKISCTDCP